MKNWLAILLWLATSFCYGQNSLDYFLQQAKTSSPLITDLNNQLASYRFDSLLLRASLKTRVDFISTNSYAPVIKGYGYDEAISNGRNISAVVQANRNFLSAKNLSAQIQSIHLQSRSVADTIQMTEQDLVRAVTEQYIVAYGDLLSQDFNLEVYELLKKEEQILKKLTRANVYRQADYLAFYVTLQQQQFSYLQAQIQYNTDYLTLNYLAGIVDTTTARITRPQLNDTMQFSFYNSVFYKRFVTDSLRLQVEKSLIGYEYKPRIGAFADAGYNSTLYNTPYKNLGVSFGVSLVIPIYDAHQKQYRLSQLNLQENTRQANRQFFVHQYQQQVATVKPAIACFRPVGANHKRTG